MGNLIKETPYGEVTAALEVLDRHGIGRTRLGELRKRAELALRICEAWKDHSWSHEPLRMPALATPARSGITGSVINLHSAWRFKMNYDESLEFKLSISDPLRIVTAYVGVYGHDEAYISERSGTKEVVASIVSFPLDITDKKLDEWAVKTRVRFAEAKELVELLRVVPRPGLDKTLPLYALGNSAKAGEENLILRASIGDDDERNVNNTLYEKNPPYWKHTTTTWTNSQFFLVIEDDGVPEPTK